MWNGYLEYVKKNGHFFKEKKKESKIRHGIEKAKKNSPSEVQSKEAEPSSYDKLKK
jgi:hypothetical protein